MPRFAVRRRPVAVAVSTAMVAASVAVLLVSSVPPPADAAAAPGSTLRASVRDPGQVGEGTEQSPNGGRDSVISGDGNSIAFVSNSRLDNLDVGWGESRAYDNVFVRDMRDADPTRHRTVMISRGRLVRPSEPTVDATPPPIRLRQKNPLSLNAPAQTKRQQLPEVDVPPDSDSFSPSISADGRYVAFITEATNLFAEDPYTDAEIVICDRDPDGDGNFDEDRPAGDGTIRDYRYYRIRQSEQDIGSYEYARDLKLAANASRLVWAEGEGDSNLRTVGLKLPTGQTGLPTAVPSGPDNTNEDVASQFDPEISADGNHIVTHVVLLNLCECPYVHAIVSTDVRTNETTRVDFDEGGAEISTDSDEFVMHPAISADGTVIAFVAEQFTESSTNSFSQFDEPTVFVVNVDYSRPPDRRVLRSTLASRNNEGNPINGWLPGLSSDGRYLAFVTDAMDAHDGEDGPNTEDTSCIRPPRIGLAGEPQLRLNGAPPPQRDDARTFCQVVVRDLVSDRERVVGNQARLPGTLASPNNRDGNAGNGNTVPDRSSTPPSLARDGRRVGYDSAASNLVSNDSNQRADVFVRTFQPSLRGSTVDFGPVELEQTLVRSATFDQIGAGPIVVETVTITGPNAADFTILGQDCLKPGQAPVGQGGSCGVTVEFAPESVGDKRAQLVVRVRGGQTFTGDLRGSGTEQPVPPRGAEFLANPAPLEFGSRLLLTNGPAQVVTITNQGELPLAISSVTPVGAAPEDYKVSANTCAATSVPAGGTCTVSVTFSPSLPGDRLAALQFTDNAVGSPHLVGLRGQSGQPTIEINPGVTPPSRVVSVIGKGFPPGKTVTLTFTTAIEKGTATVGADGTFRGSMLVYAKAKAETRTVVATVDGSPALFANGQLLVVFPSVSPAEFVVRG